MANLLAKRAEGALPVEFVLVVSSHAGVRGLVIAAEADIPSQTLLPKDFGSLDAYGRAVFDACRAASAELVVMAGFIKYVPIPPDFDYARVRGLSNEVRGKLAGQRPQTIGQASRMSGVTPAAISLLLVYLKKRRLEQAA